MVSMSRPRTEPSSMGTTPRAVPGSEQPLANASRAATTPMLAQGDRAMRMVDSLQNVSFGPCVARAPRCGSKKLFDHKPLAPPRETYCPYGKASPLQESDETAGNTM